MGNSLNAYENQRKDLALEARLLINSHEVILDVLKTEAIYRSKKGL